MFSLGWPELLIIALLALFLIGPKDIPKLMFNLGKIAKRLSYIRYAFTQQFEDFMKDAELKDLQEKASLRDNPFEEKEKEKDEKKSGNE